MSTLYTDSDGRVIVDGTQVAGPPRPATEAELAAEHGLDPAELVPYDPRVQRTGSGAPIRGRPTERPEGARRGHILVRVTDEERVAWHAKATAAGYRTLSGWLRHLVESSTSPAAT